MNDAVDRLIEERASLDRGLPGSLFVSLLGHLLLVGGAAGAALLLPPEPPLRANDIFAFVETPRGGGTLPAAEPGPAPPAPEPAPPPQKPEPTKILKPPKEPPKRGLPEPDAKRRKKPEKPPAPAGAASVRAGPTSAPGTASATPGLEFGPAGPGIPSGTAVAGDWYLATVQQKIWMIWTQQIKAGFAQSIGVTFTILADGSVAEVSITQSSGASLLDNAALRAVYSAAPFGPLPKDYGTTRYTIQALFKPLP